MIFSSLDCNSDNPIYLQIENYIKELIESGLLVSNGKLPATRELSKLLGVSRNSVITAYENLEAEGIVFTVKGKGTFISENKPSFLEVWNVSWKERTNAYGRIAEELDIVNSEIPWEKDLISFKSISPDGKLFDIEEFKKAFLNRISLEGDKILNYGYAKGYKPLMDYLLKYMKSKGIDTNNKDIIITNGFTEGLEMLLTAYTNPGDKIICENPTHNTAIKIMKVHGLEIVGVNMKEDGIDTDELEDKLKYQGIKFGYLIPSYHNPTGIVMKGEKRRNIYNLFKKYNVPIIEDGFNEELLYNSTHISPIAALDKGGSGVVYIGSFSKILFPGIRVGWILGDKKAIETLESVKRCKNIHTSFLDQGILYEYLNSGAFDKHVKKARKFYKERYELALECINKYIKPSFIYGEGGLHIYIGIKDIDSRELLQKCYERKVIFMPGDIFAVDDSIKNTLRLGLSRVTLEEIEKGIRIMGECLRE
ncbi:MAG: PLP-dependent aminotransferase family protein [Clostridiaceae bacterium]